MAAPPSSSLSSSQGQMGVASSLLHSLEQQRDHVAEIDPALTAQFTAQELRDLRMVFDTFDKNKKGYIDAFDLRSAMRVLGFKLSHEQIDEAIADIGRRIGEVSFPDFVELVAHRQGDSRDIYDEIHQGFDMMDYGKKGCLSTDDLKMVAKETGVKVSDSMIREMIEEASSSGDNTINRDEFVAVMLQTNMYKE
ncbi:caltractin-like isoform X2 [Lytechinus variegatus]|uniref:caltractin-like isoform X1 n=1 Tax=Lytechinus variegatus TaxID=7654 RepID=UPI001BB11D8C|nr:caltractin-like isoform X1 [Lytechinus variegatus]XP_041452929.1 caltractin-like isoform X2 [Lytechinus variegatus]